MDKTEILTKALEDIANKVGDPRCQKDVARQALEQASRLVDPRERLMLALEPRTTDALHHRSFDDLIDHIEALLDAYEAQISQTEAICEMTSEMIEISSAADRNAPVLAIGPAVDSGVEFGTRKYSGQFYFKIGNQMFTLEHEPETEEDFQFMKLQLLHAFRQFSKRDHKPLAEDALTLLRTSKMVLDEVEGCSCTHEKDFKAAISALDYLESREA